MEKDPLAQLYSRYAGEVYLYLFALCRSHATAEDLLQEVFLKAFLSLDGGHPNLKAWLLLVAKNLCLNRMRQEARNQPVAEPAALAAYGQGGPPDAVLDTVVLHERDRKLYAALLALPAQTRQLLVLHYFSGFTLAQAAGVLQISHANARVLAHRGRARLRELLEVQEDGTL